jgi:hypothetical protein
LLVVAGALSGGGSRGSPQPTIDFSVRGKIGEAMHWFLRCEKAQAFQRDRLDNLPSLGHFVATYWHQCRFAYRIKLI